MTAILAVTMGEPAGIGGELTLKSWLKRCASGPIFFALDDPRRLAALAAALGWNVPIQVIGSPEQAADCFARALPVLPVELAVPALPGRPDPANCPAVLSSISRAVELAVQGRISALVTNPINKDVLYQGGFRHPGHTEYLAELLNCGGREVMMLACPQLRVIPVTIHVSVAQAARDLTTRMIVQAAVTADRALRRDFGIAAPRLAVAGLNPHAGENGAMGGEDQAIIAPAVEELRAMGINARGPLPADTMFHARARAAYDCAICMYHDQALIPIKTIDFDCGVNVTLGLPIIRTSPDHGTAFEIAGTGQALEASLLAAMDMAAAMAETRGKHT